MTGKGDSGPTSGVAAVQALVPGWGAVRLLEGGAVVVVARRADGDGQALPPCAHAQAAHLAVPPAAAVPPASSCTAHPWSITTVPCDSGLG